MNGQSEETCSSERFGRGGEATRGSNDDRAFTRPAFGDSTEEAERRRGITACQRQHSVAQTGHTLCICTGLPGRAPEPRKHVPTKSDDRNRIALFSPVGEQREGTDLPLGWLPFQFAEH